MNFSRKVKMQALDTFPPKSSLSDVDAYIRDQGRRNGVAGQLIVDYTGNGGVTSIVFHTVPKVHVGEIEEELNSA